MKKKIYLICSIVVTMLILGGIYCKQLREKPDYGVKLEQSFTYAITEEKQRK